MLNTGERKPHVSEMIRAAVAHTSAVTIFGKDLAQDETFMSYALDFIDKTVIIAEVVRLLPAFMGPRINTVLANQFDPHIHIHDAIVPVAAERLAERERAMLGQDVPENVRNSEKHYVTYVEKGKCIVTPQRAMMRDPQNYAQPLEFHGIRHVDCAILACMEQCKCFATPEPEKSMPMTDIIRWQTWGTGRMARPGRFYAVAGMKQVLGLILTKYDSETLEKEATRWMGYRTCHLASWRTPIVLRPRPVAA